MDMENGWRMAIALQVWKTVRGHSNMTIVYYDTTINTTLILVVKQPQHDTMLP